MRRFLFAIFASFLVACSGSKKDSVKIEPEVQTRPVAAKQSSVPLDSAKLLRLEIAHGSFLRALALQNQGEFDLAEQFMRHAYEADPENRFLAFSVLALMEKRGTSAEAAEFAEKAKRLKGKKTSSQYAILGRIYGENSKLDSALVYYKKAVDASDQNLNAAYEYSLLLEIVHDNDELIRVYGNLLPKIGYPKSMLERQISLLAKARKDSAMADLFGDVYEVRGDRIFLENQIRLLLGMNRYDEALRATEKFRVDSAFTDDSLSARFLIAALSGLHQDSVARDTLKAMYVRHPDNGFFLLNLAMLETALKQKDQAKIHWERLSKMDRYAASGLGMLSAYALEDGDSTKSLNYLEKAYKKDPDSYRYSLLSRYMVMGIFDKAYPVLDAALEPNPKLDSARAVLLSAGKLEEVRAFDQNVVHQRSETHYQYGFFLQMQAEKLEEFPTTEKKLDSAKTLRRRALEHYRESARIENSEDKNFLFALGSNLLLLGEVDSAIVEFKKLFELSPDDALAQNYLGYFLVDNPRDSASLRWGISLIDAAVKKDPENPAYRDSKAWALYREGRYAEALSILEDLEKMKDSIPEFFEKDTSIYAHLAAVCQALSLNDRALDYYRKVLAIDPKNKNALRQMEMLQSKMPEAPIGKEP